MSDNWGRMFGGFAALAVIWIGVYWWWDPVQPPSEPPITFDETASTSFDPARRPSLPPLAAAVTEPPERGSAQVEQSRPVAEPPVVPAEPKLDPAAPRQPETRQAIIPPQFKEYTVRARDTFALIAERELGSSRHAHAISKANPFVDPTRLRIGQVIRVPLDPSNIQGKPVEGQPAPAPAAGEIEYTVRSGDTLSRIAKTYLGSEALAEAIYEANRDRLRSPDDLKVGQKLRIPASGGGAERR